jgi:hypothetical protein
MKIKNKMQLLRCNNYLFIKKSNKDLNIFNNLIITENYIRRFKYNLCT